MCIRHARRTHKVPTRILYMRHRKIAGKSLQKLKNSFLFIDTLIMDAVKKCTKCGQEKAMNVGNFDTIKKNGKIVLRPECKPCSRQMTKDYKARNKGKISNYNKTYKALHREDTRDYNREYFRYRRQTDIEFRLKTGYRAKVASMIRAEYKNTGSVELLECTHGQFIKWIEFQLEKCYLLTFENYGEVWHLDHVKPCASFDLTDTIEQKQCFHWSNYRPLDRIENMQKSDTVDEGIMAEHKKAVDEFLAEMAEEGEEYGMNYSIYK